MHALSTQLDPASHAGSAHLVSNARAINAAGPFLACWVAGFSAGIFPSVSLAFQTHQCPLNQCFHPGEELPSVLPQAAAMTLSATRAHNVRKTSEC